MRVEVTPFRSTVVPGQSLALTVTVFNTTDIISAHRVRILGVDERWVQLDKTELALFPGTSGVVQATVTLPKGIPAGTRQLVVQVRETTPPARVSLTEVELSVPAERGTRVVLDPASAQGGHAIDVGVRLANLGNTDLTLHLQGTDPEDKLGFRFEPAQVVLTPGSETTSRLRVSRRRPFAGSPQARQFSVQATGGEAPVEAAGAFIQRPLLSRGALTALGLLAAITVFAAVITITFGRVVNKSASDRDALLQVIQSNRNQGAGAPGSITGKVTLLTSGKGVAATTVEAFDASDTSKAVTSTATGSDGSYNLPGLAAGTYKLRYSGAGFSQLWYPTALSAGDATSVTVQAGQATSGVDVRLGGVPASVAGKVLVADPTGTVVTLRVPGGPAPNLDSLLAAQAKSGSSTSGGPVGSTPTTATTVPGAAGASTPSTTATSPTGSGAAVRGESAGHPVVFDAPPTPSQNPDAGAVVKSVAVDASGTFTIADVPSPSTYQLVVMKVGYAPAVQTVSLGAGEARTGIEIQLVKGDGAISGAITNGGTPVGGATITASNGTTSIGTVSLTQDDVGSFTLRDLPTPATYTLVVDATGFASQTLTVTLTQGQHLAGVAVDLNNASGSISGTVAEAGQGPAGGVGVTITNGKLTVQGVTVTVGAVGTYRVAGLPIPGTYTVTFARSDLQSQTVSVSLDPLGVVDATGVNATLQSATASVHGLVTDGSSGLGGVTVTVSSGSSTFTTTTASQGTPGRFVLDKLPPGTYTVNFTRPGSTANNRIVVLSAGQDVDLGTVMLQAQASVHGCVTFDPDACTPGNPGLPNARVTIYNDDAYPTTPLKSVTTDADGNFTITGLDARSYVIDIIYPPGSPPSFSLTLTLRPSDAVDLGTIVLPSS